MMIRRLPPIARILLALRREEGVALPVAMGVLAVISGLAALVSAGAVQVNTTSGVDRDSKRALAAAEAGLRAATYRVNKLGPSNALCATDQTSATCAVQQSLGNGATYSYDVSPVLADAVADRCAGLPIAPVVMSAYGLIDAVATRGTAAEAFAWISTAVFAGFSVGMALGGTLIEAFGVKASFGLAVAAGSLGAVLVALGPGLDEA